MNASTEFISRKAPLTTTSSHVLFGRRKVPPPGSARYWRRLSFATTLILACSAAWTYAQGSAEDYERAAELRERFQGKVFRDRVQPHWLEGNNRFWYRIPTGVETHEFVMVDAEQGERKPAFDHSRLAQALIEAGVEDVHPDRLELARLEFNNQSISFRLDGRTWQCQLTTYELQELDSKNDTQALHDWSELPNRSDESGMETWITVINTTEREIELYWLDTQGNRVSYGTIPGGGRRRQHTFEGHVWIAVDPRGRDLAWFAGEAQSSTVEVDASNPRRGPGRRGRGSRRDNEDREVASPDGKWSAFIRDFNVVMRAAESGDEFILSSEGTATNGYRGRIYWSPDSTKFVAVRREAGDEREIHLIESSPEDQLQPELHTLSYAKPGDRVAIDRPQLFDVVAKQRTAVPDDLFHNPWSIREIRWEPDSSRFTFSFNQRGHQILRILAVDAVTAAVSVVVDEESPTFIDYAGKYYCRWLEETDELIWMSERDGWNHLYLYDTRTGTVKHQITQGEWVVREVERVDEESRQIWFQAGGIHPEQDPYYLHSARVNFDGSGLTLLTEGDGTHEVQFSPDGRYLVDTWSRVDLAPVTELREANSGALICQLEQADLAPLQATGWRAPERFVAKGRDGKTDIHGIIIRPTNFDASQSYPVIEHIYAGPQSAFVPKGFRPYYNFQAMAELGFIVVKMDGMGTSHRSKAFHDVCWKNLGDGGFPDRIAWMKAAAERYPQMDLTRVGVYGGSAGGQNALRAMLAHGDFYKAAAADCGCHDNRMDKIWWNELWMGWPIGPHYEEQSNVTQAHKLQGHLLLTVGELDRNVDPASTMQVVDALIRADKDFEFLIVPGAGHGVGERPYAARRRADFFVRNLLGKSPRWTP